MRVTPVPDSALRVGHSLSFALRDAQGQLLLAAGKVIDTPSMRQQLIERGVYVDIVESQAFQRALAGKIDTMVRQNASLGRIAEARVDTAPLAATAASPAGTAAEAHGGAAAPPVNASVTAPAVAAPAFRRPADPAAAWNSLSLRAATLLRDPDARDFTLRLQRLDKDLQDLLGSDVDVGLLVLIQNACSEVRQYSVNHALLVCAVCTLAARELPAGTLPRPEALRCAALTMNIAMTTLQDQLALQDTSLSPRQRQQIAEHPQAGRQLLADLGVADPDWLEAVACHHASPPGGLAGRSPADAMARLIQRADIFAARLSPRKLRAALSATAAAKATYLDEQQQPDEAGAAIIKALGIYAPGCFVQLNSTEVAVVLRRGERANAPRVASVIGRNGTPLSEPAVRDTRLAQHEIKAAVAPKDVRVRVGVERLVQLAG